MNKLCIFGTSAVLSYVGWFLGNVFGAGWAFGISSIGALVGVYVGWKIARRFE
jgi:uncharacterized protein YcfJ